MIRIDFPQILALYRTGFTYKQISTQLRVTYSQVKNTVQSAGASPKLRTGRPPKLSPNQIDQLEEFTCSSREARQCSYLELSVHFSSWAARESAIRSALKGRWYSRCLPRRSPPLPENHMMARKVWAEQRLQWQEQEWSKVLWSDETIMPSYVTRKSRKKGETYDNTCVVDRYRKNNSWMSWGSVAGIKRGPCVFLEADWGKMTSEGYRQRILPLVVDWYRNRRQEIISWHMEFNLFHGQHIPQI
ncbi:hypothetical protein K3495_g15703 [Podosphaera aphanis]|nr:hypothetical protein K3495_g15703 [Podosphaera aphanis]